MKKKKEPKEAQNEEKKFEEIVPEATVETKEEEILKVEGPLLATNTFLQGEFVQQSDHITVVIPYAKSKAQGEELRFALRSLEKNLRTGFNVVVIGDREEWFSDEITVIEHAIVSDNPQVDIVEKLKLAIASEEVTERFIWTNDDIYIIAPVLLAHIEIPKVKGVLSSEAYSGVYRENLKRTIELLTEYDRYDDYATHTPVVFEKLKLVEMFEKHPEISVGGYLLSSVYFNTTTEVKPILLNWRTDHWALSIVTKSPDPEQFRELVSTKLFLNNAESGHSEWLMKQLEEMFPDKSDFEE